MSLSGTAKIETHCGTSIAVTLNNKGMIKPSILNAQPKTARSSKKLN